MKRLGLSVLLLGVWLHAACAGPLDRVIQVPATPLPMEDVLALLTEQGDVPLVLELPENRPRLTLPAGGHTVDELISLIARQLGRKRVDQDGIITLEGRNQGALDELDRVARGVDGAVDLLDRLPAPERTALDQGEWLDAQTLPAQDQSLLKAVMPPVPAPDREWADVLTRHHAGLALMFDPYAELLGAGGLPLRRVYLRDALRYAQNRGFGPGTLANSFRVVPGRSDAPRDDQLVYGLYAGAAGWARAPEEFESDFLEFKYPDHFGVHGPYDLSGLGPALEVRWHLAELQRQTVKAADATHPLLARYEIASVYSRDMADAPDIATKGLAGHGGEGALVRAVLYWAELDPKSILPATGSLLAKWIWPGPKTVVRPDGPKFSRVRVDLMEYELKPAAVSGVQTQRGTEFVTQTDWRLDGEGRLLQSKVLPMSVGNSLLAVLDRTTAPPTIAPDEP